MGLSSWGAASSQKDFLLYMEGSNPTIEPTALVGHSWTSPNVEASEALKYTEEYLQGGKRRTRQKTIQAAEILGRTYTIGFPSAAWSPALERAKRAAGKLVETTFYAVRTCPPNSDEQYAYVYPKGVMGAPQEAGDLISIDGTDFITETSEVSIPDRFQVWVTKQTIVNTITAAVSFFAAAFRTEEDCADPNATVLQEVVLGGGDPTTPAAASLRLSEDRAASTTAATIGAPSGSVVKSIYTEGERILVGFDDDGAASPGAVGGTAFSSDGGATWSLDSGITECVYGVSKLNDKYIAVGGTTAGASKVWYSSDGINWTASTASSLAAGKQLRDIAVEPENNYAILVGLDGTAFKLYYNGTSFTVSTLTLPSVTGVDLFSVARLDKDNFAVVGESGYYRETINGANTWLAVTAPGTVTFLKVRGNKYSTWLVTAAKIYRRSILSKGAFEEITLDDGAAFTGNITGIAVPTMSNMDDESNYAIVVTDDAEVAFVNPPYPNA